ncbi:MAG: hypothetical protein WDM78_12060 [Puia sp.]
MTTTAQLTTGESFSGTDLRDWLDATATAYAQAGKTFSIRVEFGVYDMTYLNTYEPDPAKRAKKNNRIAIFLVPYDASSGQTLQPHANIAGGTPSGGGGAYDSVVYNHKYAYCLVRIFSDPESYYSHLLLERAKVLFSACIYSSADNCEYKLN